MYINCKTYFSFQYGTIGTEELVQLAIDNGTNALALTNINNTCDAWDFVKFCQEKGVKPILGAEIRNGDELQYILLAANNKGFEWINEFLSTHLMAKRSFPQAGTEHHFFTDVWDGFVIYPWGAKPIQELLANEYIGILPTENTKLISEQFTPEQQAKLVLRQPVTFKNKIYYNVHRLLRAVHHNCLLSKLPTQAQAQEQEQFVAQHSLLQAFKLHPYIITNTYKLIDACHIHMQFGTDKNKKALTATSTDDKVLLAKLAHDGLILRYGAHNRLARERMERELEVIDRLGFNAYFLITWDVIRYAQSRGFFYVGRGSGANSIVAYCLQITDVDPIELNLFFERFLNPHRTSPPDFDIDFSWRDRDEVIDYICKRYGKKQVALLGMYSTFQYRAIVRELGKVFGLPKHEIDALAAKAQPTDAIQKTILQYGKLMVNFPNHLSIHPGGMLISEESIYQYTAMHLPPKGFPTAMLDMFVAESIGLYKLDILSQRGLGHIKDCLQLVKQNCGTHINIHDVERFKLDATIAQKIKNAETIGCFYIESPAMRQLLKKLRCSNYLTLVAASSIIRPGVAESGMMREYIQRFHNPTGFNYLHPIMKELLEETYGVMVFQEDVIKVAHYFAELDLGEADVLRRAMSGKYRSQAEFVKIKEKFFENCERIGHPTQLATEVWRQMESFAGYSFNKAHSASFAVESYQSLYLKTYYPREFMVAVINNFGGFYSTELYFLELRKAGADVQLPCINNSQQYTSIKGKQVHMGFVHIKSLEQQVIQTILRERERGGSYLHLQNFIERTAISKEQLNILIQIGAFAFTQKTKKKLLWEANFLQAKHKRATVLAGDSLFEPDEPISFELPHLPDNRIDDLYDQIELLDFPLCNPFELCAINAKEYALANNLCRHVGQTVTVLAYYVTYKVVPTKNGKTMCFGTFVDADLQWIDTIHFPEQYKAYPLTGKGFYKITGTVTDDFGVQSLQVSHMSKIGYKPKTYSKLLQ
jgi:DNA-directed DNA polymerase III PolC